MRSRSELIKGSYFVFLIVGLALLSLLPIREGISAARSNGTTTRVSVDSDGSQWPVSSNNSRISDDGRFVAFRSNAANTSIAQSNNLIRRSSRPNDDYWGDVFVHDRLTGFTSLVSVNSNGDRADNDSWDPDLSENGRYVVFTSSATNLDVCDLMSGCNIGVYMHDNVSGQTWRVSKANDGGQEDSNSWVPSVSGDGRYVAFESNSSNLIPGDTNNESDIFVFDAVTGQMTRISESSDGGQGNAGSYNPSISSNGHYVTFESFADNLVGNDDNNYCDTDYDYIYDDNCSDVFVHDLQTGQTSLVSLSSSGIQGNDLSNNPSISGDGLIITFVSYSDNLVIGDNNNFCYDDYGGVYDDNCPDIFVHNQETGKTMRVSLSSSAIQSNGPSNNPYISSDGRFVTFESTADNLVSGDTNGKSDVFVRDRQLNKTYIVSISSSGIQGGDNSTNPSISYDGRFVAFDSKANNLVSGDTNDSEDVFLHEREPDSPIYTPTATITITPSPITWKGYLPISMKEYMNYFINP